MTTKKFEALVAMVFGIAILSGLVYAEVSKVDVYQGFASVTVRNLGLGCQLRIFRVGGRIGGFVPSVSPNSFFPSRRPSHVSYSPDSLTEMNSKFGSESLTIRFRSTGEPVEYEFRRGNSPETSVDCHDLEFEVSDTPD